ncbi:ComEC/Rec2 family competence protein [Labilibaculum sp.]|uniref:ComEC/Rec2 family competence protein n=1 Tax=Labilibaculum sp. TaxID=2060723 RepID=UPI00356AE3F6
MFREFLRQNPFFRFLLPLVMAIALANVLEVSSNIGWVFFVCGLFGILLFTLVTKYRKSYSLRSWFGVFVFFLCFGFGTVRYNDVQTKMDLSISDSICFIKGEVIEPPVEKLNSYALVLKVESIKNADNWQIVSGNSMLYLQKDEMAKELTSGDLLVLRTKLQRVQNTGNPYEFDYSAYLKIKHILYSAYADSFSWKKIGTDIGFSMRKISGNWRDQLLDIYRANGIENESFDILAALTLGYKTGIDPEIKKAWADAGAMHVLAVSGLHVGIIYLIVNFMLRFLIRFKYGRVWRAVLLFLALWMYAFLTGMSPSVMRSASMFSFIVIGEMLQRKGSIYNSLAISAFFLLLIDPFLLFTVGFQFSYLAVISIVFFQAKFERLIYVGNPILKKLWQLTTVSLAAQIGTFPLAIFYFHQFPAYFLLSGYVVILMAGILIYLSALLLILSPFPLFSESLGYVLRNFVEGMNYLIFKIQALPASVISDISFSSYQLFLIYCLLFTGITLIFFKRKKAMFIFVLLLICFQLPNALRIASPSKSEMVVFNARGHSIIAFINGKNANVLSDAKIPKERRDQIIYPFILNEKVENISYDTLAPFELKVVDQKIVAIIGEQNVMISEILQLVKADVIVFRDEALSGRNLDGMEFLNCKLIVDASVTARDLKKQNFANNLSQSFLHDVRNKGAYICLLSSEN